VRIDAADGFAADDSSLFAVKRADPERVLFVHQAGDARSQLYFGAALSAAAQASFVLQPIVADQAGDVDPTKYAFVVLSDVTSIPSILENSLLRYVQNGGSVLIAAGMSEGHRQKIPVFGESATDARYYSRTGGSSTVGQVDTSHPAMKDAGGWAEAKIYYATVVDPGRSRVVARLADGVPLVMDKQMGQGHVLLFASGFDNVTNDLPLNPAFVPFVDESARYLAGVERLSGARVVDSFVALRSVTNDAASAGATVQVIGPDGKRPLSLQEEATAQSFQLSHAGFYQIRFANGRDALIAVNPDRRESGLDLIPADVLKLWSGSAGSDTSSTEAAKAAATEEKKNPYSLWWWIMLMILFAAVAESVVASRYLGTQREEA
jgi:hypothetical protein